jgi:2-phosphosulfolactate phosphatase
MMGMGRRNIEICFTPATYNRFHNPGANVVVVDILRATTAICTAFMNGVQSIIPVGTLEEAKAYKDKGFMVAAERDGIVRDFADFGNSPYNFTPDRVKGQEIVYSTTNGTNAIMMAKDSHHVLVGAYLNITALARFLKEDDRDVLVLCAAWKDRFNLEDSVFAGALAEKLLETANYTTICDSVAAALDLWSLAKNDLLAYTNKAAQKSRLKKNGLDDVIGYCLTLDQTETIPILQDNKLTTIGRMVGHDFL